MAAFGLIGLYLYNQGPDVGFVGEVPIQLVLQYFVAEGVGDILTGRHHYLSGKLFGTEIEMDK